MIDSKDNKKVKYARSLYNLKNRRKYNQFIVEGLKNIDMAKSKGCIDYILTTDENVDGILVSENVMKSIVSTSSLVNTIAVCNIPEFDYEHNKVLILDCIQDPGNLGTLIRSALAFNFDLVVCSNDTVDYLNEKVVRSSGGAIFQIPVIYDDLNKYLNETDNITIGTFVDGSNEIEQYEKFNLVIGNEGHGISDNIAKLCDVKYRISINEKIESLNAGVAGSIVMYMLGGNNGFK